MIWDFVEGHAQNRVFGRVLVNGGACRRVSLQASAVDWDPQAAMLSGKMRARAAAVRRRFMGAPRCRKNGCTESL